MSREIAETRRFSEQRRKEFARDYQARMKVSPLYALSGLLRIGALTDADLAKASAVPGYHYKVQGWAHANLGEGDYDPADHGMHQSDNA